VNKFQNNTSFAIFKEPKQKKKYNVNLFLDGRGAQWSQNRETLYLKIDFSNILKTYMASSGNRLVSLRKVFFSFILFFSLLYKNAILFDVFKVALKQIPVIENYI
jgi:hypothetical protein